MWGIKLYLVEPHRAILTLKIDGFKQHLLSLIHEDKAYLLITYFCLQEPQWEWNDLLYWELQIDPVGTIKNHALVFLLFLKPRGFPSVCKNLLNRYLICTVGSPVTIRYKIIPVEMSRTILAFYITQDTARIGIKEIRRFTEMLKRLYMLISLI